MTVIAMGLIEKAGAAILGYAVLCWLFAWLTADAPRYWFKR